MLYRGRVLIVELAVLIQEKKTKKQLFWEQIPLGATGGAVFTEEGGGRGMENCGQLHLQRGELTGTGYCFVFN